jgi:formate hydrogenlyase subunit 3/multisubunit Na+/H+ antiporter MnhD subunit
MMLVLLALVIIFAAFLKVLSSSVFGEVPEGIMKGDGKLWSFVPLMVLGVLVLVLGIYLPPQLQTLLDGATKIALAGQPTAASADGLISFVRMILP